MMKIKPGMYVKLHESNNCGCIHCDVACTRFLKVVDVSEWDESVTLEGAGDFNIHSDWIIRAQTLENK